MTKKYISPRDNFLFVSVSHGVHHLQPISGPCSIEKYPSSRMANRYTRIFDAGGLCVWIAFVNSIQGENEQFGRWLGQMSRDGLRGCQISREVLEDQVLDQVGC